jgi:hypothetical protein
MIYKKQINVSVSFRSPSLFYLLVHSRCRGFLFSLNHTQTHATVGRTPLKEGSARRRDLYLTTQTLYKRQKSMPPVGFEPTIPATAPQQTYTLGRAATGIGNNSVTARYFSDTTVANKNNCFTSLVIALTLYKPRPN